MKRPREKRRLVELRPNIYQIRSERPGSHVYLIKGEAKNVLIDTGVAANFPLLKDSLAEVKLKPKDIHLIILTHEHFDHIGASSYFYGKSLLAAHRLAANKIQIQDEFVVMGKYFDRHAQSFRADLCLLGDTVVELGNYRLRIFHTPGHCSGCICIYEPDHKLLFTGDTVLAGGAISGVFASGSISDYLTSLQLLSGLQVEEMYPGHGRISKKPQEDLRKAVEEARTFWRNRSSSSGHWIRRPPLNACFSRGGSFPCHRRRNDNGE